MFEAIEYYQSLAEKFDGRILFVPGIIVVLLGLCIWLAGLRWRKILGALAGGSFCVAASVCFGNYDAAIILGAAAIGIIIGATIEKIILGIFGTALVAAIVLVIVTMIDKQRQSSDIATKNYTRWSEYEESGVVINFLQAIEITKQTGLYILSGMIENIKSTSLIYAAAASTAMLIAGFIATIMPRIFIAVVSSSLGSAMIFAGMIMLFFYKGSKPVNYIWEKGTFCAMVTFAMIIFGTMVQLVLSPGSVKPIEKAVPDKNGDKK